MENEEVIYEAKNWFADWDNYVFALVGLAIGAVFLNHEIYGCGILAAVALIVGVRSRWQYAVTFLLLLGTVAGLCWRVEYIYTSARNNAISATTKAPGLVVTIPARYFGEGSIVAGGQVHAFSDMVRGGEVIAIGQDGAGMLKATALDRGELTAESGLEAARFALPSTKKGKRE